VAAALVSGVSDALVSADTLGARRLVERALCDHAGCRSVSVMSKMAAITEAGVREGALELELHGNFILRLVTEALPPYSASVTELLEVSAALLSLVLQFERNRPLQRRLLPRRTEAPVLLGSSPVMRELRARIERVARTDFAVLIEGESGAGKELVARQIHASSHRAEGPFVPVNCAAIVETLFEADLFGIEERAATGVRGRPGKFEAADGGTLFLDEIADLSPTAQAKLLRALQDATIERVGGQAPHRVDVRIIAATNRSLSGLSNAGQFRSDLFYRLNGVEIQVPSLRDRPDDIPDLVDALLTRYRSFGPIDLAPDALDALREYKWPGNVRELERVIQRAVTLCETDHIGLADLPPAIATPFLEVLQPGPESDQSMRAWASRYARLVLRRCGNNKRLACRILRISYHTLQAYITYPERRHRRRLLNGRRTPAARVRRRTHDHDATAGQMALETDRNP
jgi:transcriptional regulator with PAS, ATPase and Fis domain